MRLFNKFLSQSKFLLINDPTRATGTVTNNFTSYVNRSKADSCVDNNLDITCKTHSCYNCNKTRSNANKCVDKTLQNLNGAKPSSCSFGIAASPNIVRLKLNLTGNIISMRTYSLFEKLKHFQFPLNSSSVSLILQKTYSTKNPTHDDKNDEYSSSSDDESDTDTEMDISRKTFVEDENLPTNFKEIQLQLKSSRLDTVVSKAFNIARNKVEEYYLSSKIVQNGEKVKKKSNKIEDGDCIDLISGVEDGMVKFKRIRIIHLETKSTNPLRLVAYARVWKANISKPLVKK